ncbi:DUF930 domain-containing protein [Xanthobacteraceae bacterium A53D]
MPKAFSTLACALLLAGAFVPLPANAGSGEDAILRLAPAARVEQRCNAKAMGTINREQKGMRPDELLAYAFADTKLSGGHIVAPGAAVRSAGKWYHLAYDCQTAADGTQVKGFTYKLGAVIPHAEWSEHYLVP